MKKKMSQSGKGERERERESVCGTRVAATSEVRERSYFFLVFLSEVFLVQFEESFGSCLILYIALFFEIFSNHRISTECHSDRLVWMGSPNGSETRIPTRTTFPYVHIFHHSVFWGRLHRAIQIGFVPVCTHFLHLRVLARNAPETSKKEKTKKKNTEGQ